MVSFPPELFDIEEILKGYYQTLMELEAGRFVHNAPDKFKNSTYVVNKTALRKEHTYGYISGFYEWHSCITIFI